MEPDNDNSPVRRRSFIAGALASVSLPLTGLQAAYADQPTLSAGGDSTPLVLNSPIIKPISLTALMRRVQILQSQAAHGFGYYGQPRNYVPLLDFRYFKDQLRQVINDAVTSEKAIGDLLSAAKAAQASQNSLQTAENHIDDLLAQLSAARDNAVEQCNTLMDVVLTLAAQVIDQKRRMLAAQDRYNTAVQQATEGGCGLGQVINVVGAVVAVAGAAFTAGTSIAAFVATAASSGFTLAKSVAVTGPDGKTTNTLQLNPTYLKLETAAGNTKDILAKYKDLQTNLTQNPDSGRVVVLQDDFDHLSSDFDSKVDSARISPEIREEFKREAHKYVELVQARNNKLLERDGWILKISDYDNEMAQRQADKNNLADLRARNAKPEQTEYAEFLDQMAVSLRNLIVQLVWQEIRALAYWEMKPVNSVAVPLDGLTAAELLNVHDQLSAQFLLDAAGHPSGRQPISKPISVQIALTAAEAARFVSTGVLHVTIGFDRFYPFMTELTATSLRLKVNGGPPFVGEITHTGRQQFRTASGGEIEFASMPLPIGIQEGADSPVPIGGTNNYIGVSPCSDWLIAYKGPRRSELKGVQSVVLTFGGFYRPA